MADHERLLHLHGEEMARLDVDQSIHPERKRTLLISLLAPFLVFGPSVYLRKLKSISVDSLVRKRDWTTLQQDLINEWKEITLYVSLFAHLGVVVELTWLSGHRPQCFWTRTSPFWQFRASTTHHYREADPRNSEQAIFPLWTVSAQLLSDYFWSANTLRHWQWVGWRS